MTELAGNLETGGTEADGNTEFAYLDREHFTSEKFKIELRNLPRYYGMPVSVLVPHKTGFEST